MGMLEVKLHRQEFKMQYSSFVIFCKNKEALHIKPIELEQQLDLLLQEAICKRQAFFQKQRDNSAYGGKSRPITPSSRISSSVEQ